jgi:hypothetical protein
MKFKSNVELEALSNATTDTDRFIVSDSNTLKYRTGSQVLSDIGGQASLTNPVTGTGTLNFVSKFTSTGSTLGNSLVYDNGTNVGIGTTSPSTKLDVYGITTSLGFRTDTTNTNWSLISRDSAGNAPLYVQSANSITGQWIARFNYGSATANGGDNVLTVAKDSSYFLNTNVGIGTTTPGYKLSVNGDIQSDILRGYQYPINSLIDFDDDTFPGSLINSVSIKSTGSMGFMLDSNNNGTADAFIWAKDSLDFSAGTELMRLTNGGNVGIGTTAPGTKLQVSDTIAGYVSTIENLGIGADKSGLWIKTDSTWTSAIILKLTGGTSDVSIMEVNPATVRIGGGAITQNDQALHLPDNKRIGLGDSGDLQIYHDGSNSYITDSGTGNLRIRSTSLRLENTDSSNMVVANGGGSVAIYYNGSAKFSTTNTGVSVTGDVTATTFLGDLNGTINTATTAVTKANATNDTTVATTAFVQNLIGTIPAGLVFQGTWNAATNTPTLTSGSGTTGHFYIVSTSGSTNLDGVTDWVTGDWAVFIEQGATDAWEKIDNSSVLDGAGTGQTVALWSGSGTSNTLTDAPITVSGNNTTFAGSMTANTTSVPTALFGRDGTDGDVVQVFNGATGTTKVIALGATGNDGTIYSQYGNLILQQSAGSVGIGTTTPGAVLSVRNPTAGTSAFSLQHSTTSSIFDFQTGIANVTGDALVIKDVANSYDYLTLRGGNVGIGTTSPERLLSLYSDNAETTPRLLIEQDGTGDAVMAFSLTSGQGWSMGIDNSLADAFMIHNSAGGVDSSSQFAILTGGNVGIGTLFYTNSVSPANGSPVSGGSERMRISANGNVGNGNVGIGTTSPATALDVAGSITAENTGTAGVPVLDIINTTASTFNHSVEIMTPNMTTGQNNILVIGRASSTKNSGYIGYKYSGGGGSNANVLTFGHWGSDNLMNIDGLGNVGIGTTSPAVKLAVYDSSTPKIHLQNTSSGTLISDGFQLALSGTNGYLWNYENGSMLFATNATERMRITSAGNVGIGTTGPTYKLAVSGGIEAGGKVTYSKSAGSLDTTGYAVAGLLAASNGNSCMFIFTAIGHTGHYQKVVYSCWNAAGIWNTSKVIDEGTNGLDVEASANAATITFTFKSRSGSLNYTPRVTVEASGTGINNTYA